MGLLSSIIDGYHELMERHRNGPLLDGVMAACALVATSDGRVSLGQRARVDQILETLDALKVFDPHEGVDRFNVFCDGLLAHPKTGYDKAVATMLAAAQDQETKALLVRICIAVSQAASGDHVSDRVQIVMVCSLLDLDPVDFGLGSAAGIGEHDILDQLTPEE